MKNKIIASLNEMRVRNESLASSLSDSASLTDYAHLTYVDDEGRVIWSDAFDAVLKEHEIITVPKGNYFVNRTIV